MSDTPSVPSVTPKVVTPTITPKVTIATATSVTPTPTPTVTPTVPNVPTPEVVTPTVVTPKVEAKKYQHYASSRQCMRMISTTGRKITFVNYKYITCEQDIIAYLDDEISKGLNVVTKGQLMTSEEADPMTALKTKHIQEYLAAEMEEAKAKALGLTKNMGATKSNEAIAAGVAPLGTNGVTTKDSS